MFVSPTGSIRVTSFSDIVTVSGTKLTAGSDYTKTLIPSVTGTITGLRTVQLDDDHNFQLAEEVTIVESDYPRVNTIEIVGNSNKLEFDIELQGEIGDAVTVTSDLYEVEFNDISTGWYYLIGGNEGNQLIVVRESFMSPYISYSDINGALKNSRNLSKARVKKLNKVALEDVFSDFSVYGNYYDWVYDIQITVLVRLRILTLIENDFQPGENNRFATEYDKYLKKFNVTAQRRLSENSTTGELDSDSTPQKCSLTIEF